MERSFGMDFSKVRIHDDPGAAARADSLSAQAFTVGREIFFSSDKYRPTTTEGLRLIAHELAHVAQQGMAEAPGQVDLEVSEAGSADEAHAERSAEAAVAGARVPPRGTQAPLRIQRAAASCPSDWSTTVGADHDHALDMIDKARGKLGAYDGTSPAVVHDSLDRNFHATSSGFAGWVRLNLWILRKMASLASYDCEDSKSWWCDSSTTLAKTFWCVPGVDIRVCNPQYFSQTADDRSTTLIHEWVHKYGCNFDLGYAGEAGYSSAWTITALLNADPFAQLVKEIQ